MKNKNGFLLVEALVALSLLALGVSAAAEAFAQTRAAARRGETLSQLAACAQQKLIGGMNAGCEAFSWREETRPVSARLEMVTLTATWNENGNNHEETFETVRGF